jgi:hypothetical protein
MESRVQSHRAGLAPNAAANGQCRSLAGGAYLEKLSPLSHSYAGRGVLANLNSLFFVAMIGIVGFLPLLGFFLGIVSGNNIAPILYDPLPQFLTPLYV